MSSSSQSSAAESVLERVQGISALAAMAEVRKAIQWFRDQESRFTQWQVEVARIPAPPFGEQARSEWLAEKFSSLGLVDVHRDAIGNVLGMRPGIQAGAVSLSAHLDTVFPAATPLDIRRQGRKLCGPGISDNAAGIVALLALAMACREFRLPHDASLVFIGNVGEEGEGDLRGMRYVFSTSRWREGILSSVVLDGAGADTVIAEALGSRRFEIVMRGPGGHSWSDFGAPNPIVAMARAIHGFSDTHIPSSPKTTVNVGVIAGGTSVNSIPESASIRVDIRSSSAAEIDRLETELRRMVEHAVQAELAHSEPPRLAHSHRELIAEVHAIGNRPAGAVDANARIIQIARAVDRYLGNQAQIQRASTDANIPISLGREAIAIGAGGSGGGAHTLQEWFDPAGRDLGLTRILLLLLGLAGAAT